MRLIQTVGYDTTIKNKAVKHRQPKWNSQRQPWGPMKIKTSELEGWLGSQQRGHKFHSQHFHPPQIPVLELQSIWCLLLASIGTYIHIYGCTGSKILKKKSQLIVLTVRAVVWLGQQSDREPSGKLCHANRTCARKPGSTECCTLVMSVLYTHQCVLCFWNCKHPQWWLIHGENCAWGCWRGETEMCKSIKKYKFFNYN